MMYEIITDYNLLSNGLQISHACKTLMSSMTIKSKYEAYLLVK